MMDKKTVIEQTEKYYLPVFGRNQMVIDHGQGCHVWDNEGNEYVDCFAGIAVNSLGYNHPALVRLLLIRLKRLCTAPIFITLKFRLRLLK